MTKQETVVYVQVVVMVVLVVFVIQLTCGGGKLLSPEASQRIFELCHAEAGVQPNDRVFGTDGKMHYTPESNAWFDRLWACEKREAAKESDDGK